MTWLQKLEAHLADWVTSPDVLRATSAAFRQFDPIVTLGERVVVFRYDDVVQVLTNDRAFGVREIYAAKMDRTTGSFFLGMEKTPQYDREVAIARAAVRGDDFARIASIVDDEAATLVERARQSGGSIDAVDDFSRLIPLRLLESYFGTPGPDRDTMKQWMRAIFWDIFLNPGDDAAVREGARVASAELRPYLVALLADRKKSLASGLRRDDFVGRLLEQQAADPSIDDDLILRNVGGVIVGAVDTLSKAIAHSLDQLLRRPDALASAQRALGGDDAGIAAHAFEALRFNPHNPILIRQCHADTPVGTGTEHETVVRAGSTVVAMTLSAMFDGAVFERPDEFRSDRPAAAYLHFGRGLHTCFGERINRVVIPRALRALLGLDGLAYREGSSGAIAYDGPFPERMPLSFDVAR